MRNPQFAQNQNAVGSSERLSSLSAEKFHFVAREARPLALRGNGLAQVYLIGLRTGRGCIVAGENHGITLRLDHPFFTRTNGWDH
jgi:hypothetical protein